MSIRDFIDGATIVLQSPLATLLILLVILLIMARWVQRRLRAQELANERQLLECKKTEVENLGFLRSAFAIMREQRLLLAQVSGPPHRREPEGMKAVNEAFEKLRKQVHDAHEQQGLRLNRMIEEIARQQQKHAEKP